MPIRNVFLQIKMISKTSHDQKLRKSLFFIDILLKVPRIEKMY